MGKSPARWMKTLLFGKKSSRSKFTKANYEKGGADMAVDPTWSTDLSPGVIQKNDGNIEENLSVNVQNEIRSPAPHKQDEGISVPTEPCALNHFDRTIEEKAATKVQAALRGYLARRAYRTLKGIIRLQALVRGHLVRRQAVSTLYCMFRIIRLQAIARGRNVRQSDIGVQVRKMCTQLNPLIGRPVAVDSSTQMAKLTTNGFARKILASSPTPMPLHFQYDPNETNSVLAWLERWSTSHFWQPLPKQNTASRSKSHKPNIHKSSATSVEGVSELHKPRRNLRKVSANQIAHSVEEDPQIVLEKVKRNLRKVHNPVVESSLQIETRSEKKLTDDDTQKKKTPPLPEIERTQEPLIVDEAETPNTRENEKKDEAVPAKYEDCCDDDSIRNEKEKPRRRRASLPTKQEFLENNEPQQMKRSVPSYMAATKSAKAKLRGQDGPEKTNLTRRHSLSSSMNGKTSSISPRVQRTVQSAGKNGIKIDRSLQLSRDGNVRVNQAEWRR